MGPPAGSGTRGWAPAVLPIAALTVLGAALRLGEIDQSIYGDELWTYAAATGGGAGDVLDFVRSDQEITPPLFAFLAWLSAKLGDPTVLIRLPSLIAGVATIPLIYVLGLRTVGRRAALVAATLVTLSPFLSFYAVEARAYSLAVALVVGSTLCMLLALERGTIRWWVGYGALSCLAMYSHYTVAFVLLAQLAWLLWRHSDAARPALIANVAAAVLYLPWVPEFLADVTSPSQDIIGTLAPFGLHNLVGFTAAWAIGHPANGLATFWGAGLEIALFAGIGLGVVGAALALGRRDADTGGLTGDLSRTDGLILVGMAAVACPAGAALVSLVGDDQFLPRNLAASWPAWSLLLAAVVTAGPLLIRTASTVLVVGAFAVGAARTTDPDWGRPDIAGAAELIEAETGPGDVVLDATSPGGGGDLPVARTLDVQMNEPYVRIGVSGPEDVSRGVAEAAGGRVAVVGPPFLVAGVATAPELAGVRPVVERVFEGTLPTEVLIYKVPAGGRE